MFKSRKRLIPWRYKFGVVSVLLIPLIILSVYLSQQLKENLLNEARKELERSAHDILNLARQKFDLVHTYQFQEEHYYRTRLKQMVGMYVAMSRQVELETARKMLTRDVAKKLIVQTISNFKFGELGYGFILDRNGIVLAHPQLPAGLDMSSYPYVEKMLARGEGVLRYWWKHPGEPNERERLMAFQMVRSLGWYICIAVPISEVMDSTFEVQQFEGLFEYVKSLRLKWRGQAMILSTDGRIIAHPEFYKEEPVEELLGASKIIRIKSGYGEFRDMTDNTWCSGVRFFAPKEWIIAVTASEKEILRPYRRLVLEISIALMLNLILGYIAMAYLIKRLSMSVRSTARRKISPI